MSAGPSPTSPSPPSSSLAVRICLDPSTPSGHPLPALLSRKDEDGDLSLVFPDGSVHLDRCVLAAVSTTALKKLLLKTETDVILIPDCSVDEARCLRNILYRGRVARVTDRIVDKLLTLSRLLKLKTLAVNKEECQKGEEEEEEAEEELRVRVRAVVSQDENVTRPSKRRSEDTSPAATTMTAGGEDGVRRSKRTRVINRRYHEEVSENHVNKGEGKLPRVKNVASASEESDEGSEVEKEQSDWFQNFTDSLYKQCYICQSKFLGLHQLTSHLRTHPTGPFRCQVCGHAARSGIVLHEHIRGHARNLILSKQKRKKKDLNRHRFYRCSESDCSFTCNNAKAYSAHMTQTHNQKPFQCQLCPNSYMSKGNLDDHIVAKHKSVDIACDICGKRFGNRPLLLVHRRDQHELGERRRVHCDVCGFASKGVRNLRKHMLMHKGDLPRKYQCSHCSRMFRNKFGVVVHERTHTGEAPFRCNLCKTNFKRAHHLNAHLRSGNHLSRQSQIEADRMALPDNVVSFDKSGRKSPRSGSSKDASSHSGYQEIQLLPPQQFSVVSLQPHTSLGAISSTEQFAQQQRDIEGGDQILMSVADETNAAGEDLDLQNAAVLLASASDDYQQFIIP